MVCPDNVRPSRSVMVTEISRGSVTPFVEQLLNGHDSCLGVEGVENRLDDHEVHTAVDQATRLLSIGGTELVEGESPEGRVVDIGRQRERAIGGTDGAGDEARFLWCPGGPFGRARLASRAACRLIS